MSHYPHSPHRHQRYIQRNNASCGDNKSIVDHSKDPNSPQNLTNDRRVENPSNNHRSNNTNNDSTRSSSSSGSSSSSDNDEVAQLSEESFVGSFLSKSFHRQDRPKSQVPTVSIYDIGLMRSIGSTNSNELEQSFPQRLDSLRKVTEQQKQKHQQQLQPPTRTVLNDTNTNILLNSTPNHQNHHKTPPSSISTPSSLSFQQKYSSFTTPFQYQYQNSQFLDHFNQFNHSQLLLSPYLTQDRDQYYQFSDNNPFHSPYQSQYQSRHQLDNGHYNHHHQYHHSHHYYDNPFLSQKKAPKENKNNYKNNKLEEGNEIESNLSDDENNDEEDNIKFPTHLIMSPNSKNSKNSDGHNDHNNHHPFHQTNDHTNNNTQNTQNSNNNNNNQKAAKNIFQPLNQSKKMLNYFQNFSSEFNPYDILTNSNLYSISIYPNILGQSSKNQDQIFTNQRQHIPFITHPYADPVLESTNVSVYIEQHAHTQNEIEKKRQEELKLEKQKKNEQNEQNKEDKRKKMEQNTKPYQTPFIPVVFPTSIDQINKTGQTIEPISQVKMGDDVDLPTESNTCPSSLVKHGSQSNLPIEYGDKIDIDAVLENYPTYKMKISKDLYYHSQQYADTNYNTRNTQVLLNGSITEIILDNKNVDDGKEGLKNQKVQEKNKKDEKKNKKDEQDKKNKKDEKKSQTLCLQTTILSSSTPNETSLIDSQTNQSDSSTIVSFPSTDLLHYLDLNETYYMPPILPPIMQLELEQAERQFFSLEIDDYISKKYTKVVSQLRNHILTEEILFILYKFDFNGILDNIYKYRIQYKSQWFWYHLNRVDYFNKKEKIKINNNKIENEKKYQNYLRVLDEYQKEIINCNNINLNINSNQDIINGIDHYDGFSLPLLDGKFSDSDGSLDQKEKQADNFNTKGSSDLSKNHITDTTTTTDLEEDLVTNATPTSELQKIPVINTTTQSTKKTTFDLIPPITEYSTIEQYESDLGQILHISNSYYKLHHFLLQIDQNNHQQGKETSKKVNNGEFDDEIIPFDSLSKNNTSNLMRNGGWNHNNSFNPAPQIAPSSSSSSSSPFPSSPNEPNPTNDKKDFKDGRITRIENVLSNMKTPQVFTNCLFFVTGKTNIPLSIINLLISSCGGRLVMSVGLLSLYYGKNENLTMYMIGDQVSASRFEEMKELGRKLKKRQDKWSNLAENQYFNILELMNGQYCNDDDNDDVDDNDIISDYINVHDSNNDHPPKMKQKPLQSHHSQINGSDYDLDNDDGNDDNYHRNWDIGDIDIDTEDCNDISRIAGRYCDDNENEENRGEGNQAFPLSSRTNGHQIKDSKHSPTAQTTSTIPINGKSNNNNNNKKKKKNRNDLVKFFLQNEQAPKQKVISPLPSKTPFFSNTGPVKRSFANMNSSVSCNEIVLLDDSGDDDNGRGHHHVNDNTDDDVIIEHRSKYSKPNPPTNNKLTVVTHPKSKNNFAHRFSNQSPRMIGSIDGIGSSSIDRNKLNSTLGGDNDDDINGNETVVSKPERQHQQKSQVEFLLQNNGHETRNDIADSSNKEIPHDAVDNIGDDDIDVGEDDASPTISNSSSNKSQPKRKLWWLNERWIIDCVLFGFHLDEEKYCYFFR